MAAAGADPPPKDGLGAAYRTVRFTASAHHPEAHASARRLGSDCDDSTSPAGNGAACVPWSAAPRRRLGYLRWHVRGPSAALAKSSRSRWLTVRGHSSRRHTHTVNMRSTSSDHCRFALTSKDWAGSEAVPSSSACLRCCGAQLAPMSSTWSSRAADWSGGALARRRASFSEGALLTGVGPDHRLAGPVARERRYERGAARRAGASPHAPAPVPVPVPVPAPVPVPVVPVRPVDLFCASAKASRWGTHSRDFGESSLNLIQILTCS